MSKVKITKELIEQREAKLEEVRKHLKTQFIGIDEIIDKFINSVKIWYVLPEIQTRPLIINLWGITGVGKTDLVRKFAKAIEHTDRFTEIQMDSREGNATIEDYLENTFDSAETQGILLLDEIQRFRTISNNGAENNSNKFQDLWMLLSDGTFQSNSKIKQELMKMLLEEDYWNERYSRDEDEEDEELETSENTPNNKKNKKKREMKYKTSLWEASKLKRLLKLKEPMSEIMMWSRDQKMSIIKESLNSDQTYEGRKYTKLLIIISGNLDEAFTMAGNVDDSDCDADVYHKYSKSINIISIKEALTRRFKPEQIARLGNNHLIYPIPSKAAYRGIIVKRVNDILAFIKEQNGINITVDDSVVDVIYKNGVFPTQGVRPVISTVSAILENSLPCFIFEYLKNNIKGDINLSFENGNIVSKIGKETIKYEVPTVLDDIKKKQSDDHRALVSVHEAGHAVLYALLFKTVPTQIVAATTSNATGGFVGIHPLVGTKEQLLNDITITFGGRVAEEMVFGKGHVSKGAASDYHHATAVAGKIVRNYGMHEDSIGYYVDPNNSNGVTKYDLSGTDDMIEEILTDCYEKSTGLLRKNTSFLYAVSEALMEKSTLSPEDFQAIAKEYVGDIPIVDAGEKLLIDYKEKLDKKLKNR